MLFIVKIGNYSFKFTDKNDAVIFAEIAKSHYVEPDAISIRVELYTVTEIED